MPHKYNSFIELLPEKADIWRNYCICTSCRDTIGRSTALLNKIVNKNERIRTHLKRCEHFKNMYPEKFVEFFESEIENENTVNSNKRSRNDSVNNSSRYLKINKVNEIYYIKYFNIKKTLNNNYFVYCR